VELGVAAKALDSGNGSAWAGRLGAAVLISDDSARAHRPWHGGPRQRRRLGEARRPSAVAATRCRKATYGAEALGCSGSSTNLEGGGRFDAPWSRAAHLDNDHLGNGNGDNLTVEKTTQSTSVMTFAVA
jgi:hypothetical protein